MKLDSKQWTIVLTGVLILGVAVHYAMENTGAPGTDSGGKVPRHESGTATSPSLTVQAVSADVNMLGVDSDGSLSWASRLLHTFHPIDHIAPDVDYKHYVRHRYPTVTGTNISTLIHRGYSAMMVPSNRDYDYFVRPPADDEFTGGF